MSATSGGRSTLRTGSPLREGETILLHDRKGRRYRVRLASSARQSLHTGTFLHDAIIGQPEGVIVSTSKGSRLLALRPTFEELLLERERMQVQPIYPTDIGSILMHADVCPGARVVEAGTGTAALTMALVRAVGESGHVTSYEARPEFHAAARDAIVDAMGEVPPNLSLKLGSVYERVDEREVDRVLLDLPEPWQAVAVVAEALLPGGVIFAHCPNVNQVQQHFDALRRHGGFALLGTVEVLERPWVVRGPRVRPADRMVAHTGFLTFARRIAGSEVFDVDETDRGPRR